MLETQGLTKLRVILNPMFFTIMALLYAYIKDAYIQAGARTPNFLEYTALIGANSLSPPPAHSGLQPPQQKLTQVIPVLGVAGLTTRWVALCLLGASVLLSLGMAALLRGMLSKQPRGVPAAIRWCYCATSFLAYAPHRALIQS